MKIGVIADDFTGASDIALTLAEGGMRTVQYVGVPAAKVQDTDAGVVALKTRSCSPAEAVTQSLQACRWLQAQGAEQIVFKVCSTFDSTDQGNIGPVAAVLADHLQETHVITCPAFPENGRSVFMGHLFVHDMLLNESGMQDHPLTPMKDADLRRVLAAQTDWDITHVPVGTVRDGVGALQSAISGLAKSMVIVDAIQNEDLLALGAAAKGRRLLTGGSGIAIGLPANFGASPAAPDWSPNTGRGVVLSGSCSRATRRQVERFAKDHPIREIGAAEVFDNASLASTLTKWVLSQSAPALVYSSADPDAVRAAQTKYGKSKTANAFEALFSEVAARLADAGISRMVVAGGETSGAVVEGLGAQSLRIGPRLAAGVPAVKVDDRNLALALKSGNFGGDSFFSEALDRMTQAS